MNQFYLKKGHRAVYPFPWVSGQVPQPWPSTHMRVIIPLSEAEKRNSHKKCHVQVVNRNNILSVQPARLKLRKS